MGHNHMIHIKQSNDALTLSFLPQQEKAGIPILGINNSATVTTPAAIELYRRRARYQTICVDEPTANRAAASPFVFYAANHGRSASPES